jgi:hypothetical protein
MTQSLADIMRETATDESNTSKTIAADRYRAQSAENAANSDLVQAFYESAKTELTLQVTRRDRSN